MLVRSRPFGEWVAVYYDREKTDANRLLERLRTSHCREARPVAPATGRLGEAEFAIMNPVLAPGDFLHVEARLPDGSALNVRITVPEGWTLPDGAARELKAGTTRCDVQLPRDTKPGTRSLIFERVDQEGGSGAKVELKVDVVSWVKDR